MVASESSRAPTHFESRGDKRMRNHVAGAVLALLATSSASRLGHVASHSRLNASSFVFTTAENATVQVDFLRDDVFRIWAAAPGEELRDELVDAESDQGDMIDSPMRDRIVIKTDYAPVTVAFEESETYYEATTSALIVRVYRAPLTFECLEIHENTTQTLWKEVRPLDLNATTSQELWSTETEQIYGGGQQNGRIGFKGHTMHIGYSGGWDENDRPSPAPFYFTSSGYGVLRNTWRDGAYEFATQVSYITSHKESRFDAYYFSGGMKTVVDRYTELTGRPHMVPRWGLYLGDADCYNDGDNINKPNTVPEGWTDGPTGTTVDVIESVGEKYAEHNMPVGWILPNDGYGCGYSNLSLVSDKLGELGIRTGLWTQKGVDRIKQEVADGIRVMKLDVAWTGPGKLYSMVAQKQAHEGLITNAETRGMVWTVMGWAGMQRYSVAWTGDQSGSMDYVRWHIPTFTGSGLSGMAYASSDVDGIFGGTFESYTRDLQFKAFTPVLIAMSGWTSVERKHPWWFEEPYRSINRKFLMLKSALVPYIYNFAHEAEQTGAPIVRAMLWEYPSVPEFSGEMYKYQYTLGTHLLVAPVFETLTVNSGWKRGIFLPEGTWFDFWNGIRTVVPANGTEIAVPVTLSTIPVFVRAGAIVPMYHGARSDDLQPKDYVELHLWPYGQSTFELVEDDGETYQYRNGLVARTEISMMAGTDTVQDVDIVVNGTKGTYMGMPSMRTIKFIVHTQTLPSAVTVNGNEMNFSYSDDHYGTVVFEVMNITVTADLAVTISLNTSAPVPTTPEYPAPPMRGNFRKKDVTIVKNPVEYPASPFSNAWDGDLATTYRSAYVSPASNETLNSTVPTDFIVDLAHNYTIHELIYTPSVSPIGRCGQYQIWVSMTPEFSLEPTNEGEWNTSNSDVKFAVFSPPTAGRYLKFQFVTGTNDSAYAAEFDLLAVAEFPTPITHLISKDMASVSGFESYNQTLTGTPLTMNSVVFSTGIHVTSTTGICMSLEGSWDHFSAEVGIDDSCKIEGNKVRAMVLVNGKPTWTWELSGAAVVKFKVDLAGAHTLALVVTDSDGNSTGDCVNWVNPSLTGSEDALVDPLKCSCINNWENGGLDMKNVVVVEAPPSQPNSEFSNALDGDTQSIYHSPWSPANSGESVPLSFVVDLGRDYDVNGISYLPRQSGANGMVLSYSLDTSLVYAGNETQWVQGTMGDWPRSKSWKTASMNATLSRYIKFTALTSVGNFFSAAEFEALVGPTTCPSG